MTARELAFFLGGHDLEMVTIRDLLAEVAPAALHDRGLRWGAHASDYRAELAAALEAGQVPVLVELPDDMGLTDAITVDHHGARASAEAPTALHQVFALLGLPDERWTRWFELVAANDRGYIAGLEALGATRDEVVRVRAADRRAQGITEEEEAQAEQALHAAARLCDGRLTVVRAPHARLAAIEDRLHAALGGPGVENLLVLAPSEVNFSGRGDIVRALDARYPGGWSGGALPTQGFWGCAELLPEVIDFVAGLVCAGVTGART
jgi:hypothetical protein